MEQKESQNQKKNMPPVRDTEVKVQVPQELWEQVAEALLFSAGDSIALVHIAKTLGVDQRTAQGINLLFFLPTALSALICHWKSGCLDRPTLKNAVPAAVPAALLGAWIATAVDVELLRRPFGAYLLLSGISLILPQKRKKESGS